MRQFVISAVAQYVQYIILTINFRAIAHTQYMVAGMSAALAAWLAYTIVRRIVREDSWFSLSGMMVGGALGDMTGIFLTRHWN